MRPVTTTIIGQSYAEKIREKLLKKHSAQLLHELLSIDSTVFGPTASFIEVSTTSLDKNSNFYTACRNGDLERVRACIEHMDIDTLNKIEPDGSTALHAASSYGHSEIVKLLLEWHCSCQIKDKYSKTAEEVAVTDEIHHLFNQITPWFSDYIDLPPKSDRVEIYQNLNDEDVSELATRITKARLAIYSIHKYEIEVDTNTAQLEKIFRKHCEQNEVEANECLKELEEFKKSKNIHILIALYLMETFVYRPSVIDDTFLIEMYINFTQFNKGHTGSLYSGHRMTKEQFEPYRYAYGNKKSILETRRICSTTRNDEAAKMFATYTKDETLGVIFNFMFRNECYTCAELKKKPASLKSLEYFESEQEAMILPGTFFKITHISEPSSDGVIRVELINIPVDRDVLIKEINEFN